MPKWPRLERINASRTSWACPPQLMAKPRPGPPGDEALYQQRVTAPLRITEELGISRTYACYCVKQAGIRLKGPHKDLTGKTFGRLTVLKRLERNPWGNFNWLCQCSCGETTTAPGGMLTKGQKRSCGCLRVETATASGKAKKTHGLTGTKAHNSWAAMLDRCRNPNLKEYGTYGGRGVTVCDRWDPAKGGSFENFHADMGDPPGPNHSIDKDKLGDGMLYSWRPAAG